MADPHDSPPPVDAMVSPSVGRQEPDPPDIVEVMGREENESSHYGPITGEICGEEADPAGSEICPAATDEGATRDVNPMFEEAEHNGEWFKAIEARDCLSLMNILKPRVNAASPVSWCFKTGEQSRTALHVAAMQGCFRLAKQLIDLMLEGYPSSEIGTASLVTMTKRVLHEVVTTFIYGKDGRSGLSAFEMANDIIGNTSISQYILYVGRNQKDTKHSGMYEAYEGTEWHTALARGDCGTLKVLLKWNSRCLLETCGKLSVLDVAILKGDKELVVHVMEMFLATSDGLKISWHIESYFPSELKWEQIAEHALSSEFVRMGTFPSVKSRKKLDHVRSALELADTFGRLEIKELLQKFRDSPHQPRNVVDQGRVQRLLTSLSLAGLFENGVGSRPPMNGERVELKAVESELPEFKQVIGLVEEIQKYWESKWTEQYMADVDYNFEDKCSLRFSMLRLHYAFKHPHECRVFIHNLHGYSQGKSKFIFDGQGRTPLHVLVDHYNPDYGVYKVPYHAIEWTELDSRGRCPMIRAITKQFLEPDTMVSRHIIENNEARFFGAFGLFENGRKFNVWLFKTSILFEDIHVLCSFLKDGKRNIEIKAVVEKVNKSAMLIAAAIGNQTLFRECFKYKLDCMVEDEEKRTALHYAANPDVLNFTPPPTWFFCSIENPKKVEEKWMKRHKAEKGNLNVGQYDNGNPQSNASVGRKACILTLLQAGVDLSQVDEDGNIPDPGSSSDAEFQSWWYNILVKDSEDKKNSFNQAGNALSVVGTLVAATSYIGPLQPPLSYADAGYVATSRSLVKVFMWTNTLAFYLAVASVMFAVVPSLPMPQEGVLDELRRARHTVSSSLFLLLAAIGCIIVSFAVASAVVIDNGVYYGGADFLLPPSVIGWFFCAIAIVSFLIRVMRLVFYRNPRIRHIYKFSFSAMLKRIPSKILSRCLKVVLYLVSLLLIVPACLELGLMWMIHATGRGLRRLWKERFDHREPASLAAQEEDSSELPTGPIMTFLDWICDWGEDI